MIDAMMTMLSDAIVVWLMPSSSWRLAVGIRTCQNSCALVAPDMTPDSTTSDGMLRSPRIVFRTMGAKEYKTLAVRPTTGPNPNSTRIGSK